MQRSLIGSKMKTELLVRLLLETELCCTAPWLLLRILTGTQVKKISEDNKQKMKGEKKKKEDYACTNW